MSTSGDTSIRMNDEEFVLLRDLVKDLIGLLFEESSKYLMEMRLGRRLEVHQIRSFKDYYYFLKYDRHRDEELNHVFDLLTINETYFFREDYQLKALSDEIIPEIMSKKKEKSLRIWSAGCSTGEEPYSIAMILLELQKKGLLSGWQIDVLGSDISLRVLAAARKGEYGTYSFREMNNLYYQYFDSKDDKKIVRDEVRKLVTITHLNLLDANKISLLKSMDVILCRNVLIYFDNKTRKKIVGSFYEKLCNGGYLLLGHSESLMNISTQFELRHLKNDMVYRKPE